MANYIKKNWLIILIFIVAIFARTYQFGKVPGGLNQDEASSGYEAYSLSEYGIDRNGYKNPVYFVSWGSGQNALYSYLLIPIIKIFGLSVVTVRSVNLIFSIISLFIFYSLFKKVFHQKIAIISLAFLAITPWHIMIARWGLESNLFPPLFLIGVYFLILGIDNTKLLYLSTIFFAISMYSYGTAHAFVPIFLLCIYIYLFIKKKTVFKTGILNAVLFCVISAPIIIFILMNQFNIYPNDINLGMITIPKLYVQRTESILNIFSADPFKTILGNMKNIIALLVFQTDGHDWNNVTGFGMIYLISLPIVICGIVSAIKRRKDHFFYIVIFIWFALSFMLALIMDVNINRINIIVFPFIIFAILGLSSIFEKYKPLFCGSIIAYLAFFVMFLYTYFGTYHVELSKSFFSSLDKCIEYTNTLSYNNKKVYIVSSNINMPYIHVLFFNKINPYDFLGTRKSPNLKSEFYVITEFNNYEMGEDLDLDADKIYISSNIHLERFIEAGYKVEEFENYFVAYMEEEEKSEKTIGN